MTESQAIQYHRFRAAGYDPEDAAMLIARGVWLGTQEMTPEIVKNIERYRAERDANHRLEMKGRAAAEADTAS